MRAAARSTRRLAATARVALLGLLAAACAACGRMPGTRPDSAVLIVVDTLRADHLRLYGYARPTSPHLDRLAADGIVFEQARSQAACTCPSVNSLLTSRWAGDFLGMPYGDFGIPADVPTVASVLRARGWRTFAASASGIVRATPSKLNRRGGFGAGFDVFDERCEHAPAACVNARFREFLDGRPGRFFAYLHYFDPHDPYAPPPEHPRRFAAALDAAVPAWARAGIPNRIERALAAGRPPYAPPEVVEHLVALYDDEIAYLDARLGELFADLRARGHLERTIVVLAADHGEMFLEHGDVRHCRKQFDTVIRTPLVVWIPGVPGGRRIAQPVGNLDVVPTLLDYLGVDAAKLGLEGRSLRPLIDGAPGSAPAYAYSMQTHLRSVTDGRYKLVRDLRDASVALYDLDADPGETTDRAAALPDERARLERALGAWLAAQEGPGSARRSVERGTRVEESLRALGYLE